MSIEQIGRKRLERFVPMKAMRNATPAEPCTAPSAAAETSALKAGWAVAAGMAATDSDRAAMTVAIRRFMIIRTFRAGAVFLIDQRTGAQRYAGGHETDC